LWTFTSYIQGLALMIMLGSHNVYHGPKHFLIVVSQWSAPDRLRSLVLRPGHEYRETFSNKEEWDDFHRANSAVTDPGIIDKFAASISRTGIKFLDKTVKAAELELVDGDNRNSFVHDGLASRNRALAVELLRAFMAMTPFIYSSAVFPADKNSLILIRGYMLLF
tara:strand:- start:1192 stop:1686 length:495 start_codon:yes stop_codon:yes gene_type:complete